MSIQPRIAVLGSCVTRQAFLHHEGPESWRLERPVHYQARTSFVSLLSPPLEPPEPLLRAIPDPFEQRAARDDFRRSFWSKLAASQPDLLLLDLVDERFDLLAAAAAADGEPRYATLSGMIETWDHEQRKRARRQLLPRLRRRFAKVAGVSLQRVGLQRFGLRRLRRLSLEVNQLWQGAAAGFAERLRSEHPRLRVALHLAPLAETFADGARADPRDRGTWWEQKPQHLAALRTLLSSYGQQLRQFFPEAPVLQPPAELHRMARRHPWGEAPWHYTTDYYRALVRQIRGVP
jgi:hypothetical protein